MRSNTTPTGIYHFHHYVSASDQPNDPGLWSQFPNSGGFHSRSLGYILRTCTLKLLSRWFKQSTRFLMYCLSGLRYLKIVLKMQTLASAPEILVFGILSLLGLSVKGSSWLANHWNSLVRSRRQQVSFYKGKNAVAMTIFSYKLVISPRREDQFSLSQARRT